MRASNFPVFDDQPCDSRKFPGIVGDQSGLVCQRDGGDQQVIRANQVPLSCEIGAQLSINACGRIVKRQVFEIFQERGDQRQAVCGSNQGVTNQGVRLVDFNS